MGLFENGKTDKQKDLPLDAQVDSGKSGAPRKSKGAKKSRAKGKNAQPKAPVEEVAVEDFSMEEVSMEEVSAEEVAIEAVPAEVSEQEQPAQEAPVQEVPVQIEETEPEQPAEEAPVQVEEIEQEQTIEEAPVEEKQLTEEISVQAEEEVPAQAGEEITAEEAPVQIEESALEQLMQVEAPEQSELLAEAFAGVEEAGNAEESGEAEGLGDAEGTGNAEESVDAESPEGAATAEVVESVEEAVSADTDTEAGNAEESGDAGTEAGEQSADAASADAADGKAPKAAKKGKSFDISKIVDSVKTLIGGKKLTEEEEEEAIRLQFEKNGGGRQEKFLLFSIRNKIVFGFLVPIIFMIVIGVTAYKRASIGMSDSFQLSTKQTIATATEYVDITCSFVEAEAKKYSLDNDTITYFRNLIPKSDQVLLMKTMNGIQSNMNSSKSNNDFINNIHILTKPGLKMLSTQATKVTLDQGTIEGYVAELGDEKKNLSPWTDHHDYLDGEMGLVSEDYIIVYQIYGQARAAIVTVDVSASAVQNFISSIDLGEGSIVGFVTMNGRELIRENVAEGKKSILTEGEKVFYGQEFFDEIGEDNMDGAKSVKYKGKNYLFIYSRSKKNDCTVCALVPMALVTKSAEGIKLMTIGLVILACIIVVGVCFFVASGIQNNMNRIAKKLGEVAQGDLTVYVTAKGRDEFRGLAGSANNMIENTKNLVNKVSDATDQLEESSREVEEASGVINDYSKDITLAINDINEGMARQSVHAQECVNRTDILSNQIQDVSRVVEKVEKLVSNTQEMIDQGMEIAHVLGKRADETTKMTVKVGESINSLRRESEIINTFVETISEISEQTNLLSLNASIEAARAGEVGRGFAVVAQEIRKLADSSANAASEISKNVSHISAQTMNSVESAGQAQAMVELQTKAVGDTIRLFEQMQERMVQLVDGLQEIVTCTEKADSERSQAVAAVRNISEIIEETAANAETVNDVAGKLLQNVENLNRTAGELGENMEDLKSEIAVFKR